MTERWWFQWLKVLILSVTSAGIAALVEHYVEHYVR